MPSFPARLPIHARLLLLVTVGALGPALPACSQEGGADGEPPLGRVAFPTSGDAAGQSRFLRGVLYLHNFHYGEAAAAFREAQRLDPGFAMAYWGEAMTYTHPVWNEQDREAARAALERLAPTAEQRRALAPTEREKAYLDAVEVLYGEGPKARRDTAYAEAMGELAAAWPDDVEAQLFHALALIGLSQGERNVPTYMRAGAIATRAFYANPGHPGAAHYVIHSFDDPVHAPLGLDAARAYSEIAPGAAHAQHMTSHIFVALGMWDETVAANEVASSTEEPVEATGKRRFPCGHYGSWLHYGYLQQGRYGAASEILAECRAVVDAGAEGSAGSLAWMEAAHVVDAREWEGGAVPAAGDEGDRPWIRVPRAFARGYAAAGRGDLAAADAALASLEGVLEAERAAEGEGWPRGQVMARMLRGLLLLERGDAEAGVAELERAAALEDAQPVEFGPPPTAKPPHELLGEALLAVDRPEEAASAFRAALARTPARALALLGMARAASRAGDEREAAEAYATLREIWHAADPGRPELSEAARFLAGR